jgi:hypothetical protein
LAADWGCVFNIFTASLRTWGPSVPYEILGPGIDIPIEKEEEEEE